jgi:hypothetical protein
MALARTECSCDKGGEDKTIVIPAKAGRAGCGHNIIVIPAKAGIHLGDKAILRLHSD